MHLVLVVEDHDDTRTLIADALRSDGHIVVEACTGSEALEAYKSTLAANMTLDMVITDQWMPGMLGLSLMACLRAAGCTCPALLITAHDHASVRAQATSLGTATMIKPFDITALRRAVASSV
jgi:CheY-like chemotaxis protein